MEYRKHLINNLRGSKGNAPNENRSIETRIIQNPFINC